MKSQDWPAIDSEPIAVFENDGFASFLHVKARVCCRTLYFGAIHREIGRIDKRCNARGWLGFVHKTVNPKVSMRDSRIREMDATWEMSEQASEQHDDIAP